MRGIGVRNLNVERTEKLDMRSLTKMTMNSRRLGRQNGKSEQRMRRRQENLNTRSMDQRRLWAQ